MEYSMQKLEKSRIELAISIEKDEWQECIKEAYNKNKYKYKLEGFRAGKVPYSVLVSRFGKEVFYEDGLDVALLKYYSKILDDEKSLEPLGKPDIDIKEVSEDGVKAVITIEVYPEFTLGDYKGLKIDKVKIEVTDEQVEAEVKKDVEKASRFISVTDREAKDGDKVVIDYSGSVDGVKFEGGTAEKQELTLGSNMFIPGFEEQVVGMNIGDEKDIKVTFPEEYGAKELAGKESVFAIKLHEILTKEQPVIDDEFAKDISEFDTLKDYKDDIKNKLIANAEEKAKYQEEDKLVETITENTQIDIPLALIADEIDRSIDELKMRMRYSGLKFEDYLSYSGLTEEKLREDRAKDAEKTVKTRLVLMEIVKKEGMTASKEEIDVEITAMAEKAQKTFDEYKSSLNEYDIGRIMNKIVTEKLFKFLRENNTIE